MHLLNKLVVAAVPLVPRPVVRYFAGRYIAGETLDHAIRCVRQLNSEGVCATMDVLGEDITTRAKPSPPASSPSQVLHTIAQEKLDSNLSIKLTSLGLKIDKAFCIENVREILKVAAAVRDFVRIDMEDSTCTTDTIDVFRTLHREFPEHRHRGAGVSVPDRRGCPWSWSQDESRLPPLQGDLQGAARDRLPGTRRRCSRTS